VQVVSDRTFSYGVSLEHLWARFERVHDYRGWWPWLRQFDAVHLGTGEVWHCVIRPPVPYTVRFAIHLDEVVPHRTVRATVGGDIEGHAALEVGATADGCWLRLASHLSPARGVLQTAARVAPPLAQWAHDQVLTAGARQFGATFG
jgi:hypothetical protein